MLQDYFYLTQSVYAVMGILFFLIAIVLLLVIAKKLSSLEKKIEKLIDKGLGSARAAENLLETGEKIIALSALKIFKKITNKKEDK